MTDFPLSCCLMVSVAMQYLWETSLFRFSDGDNFQTTPLHMAASMGNTDVVRYLLRNNVSAFHLVN